MPDPEPLKGNSAAEQRGLQRQQQQQQGAPGSGRAFQRVKAEEWLDKKACLRLTPSLIVLPACDQHV